MVPKVPLRTRPKPRLREVGVLVMNVLCCVAHRNIHLDKKVGIDIWNRTHRDRYIKRKQKVQTFLSFVKLYCYNDLDTTMRFQKVYSLAALLD